MTRIPLRRLVLSALFVALGLLLPFLTGQIPQIGSRLLPMHLPILLCGLCCGGLPGLLAGFVTPLLRSVLFGMPPLMPTAVAMAFELAAYGAVAGLAMSRLPRTVLGALGALLCAMVAGRLVWGAVSFALSALMGGAFTWSLFLAGAVTGALPGIALQIVLIPPVAKAVISMEKR